MNGAGVVRVPMGTRLTIVESDMRPVLDAAGFRGYEDFVRREHRDVVGGSGTTRTRRIRLGPGSDSEDYYLKAYEYRGSRWRHRWRTDKGAVEARNYRLLRERCGILVPDVVAFGSRRRGWRLLDAFILTRGVPAETTLDVLFKTRWPSAACSSRDPQRTWLLREVSGIVSRMHRAGFFHVDLQWRNLLVSDDSSSSRSVFVLDSPRGGLRRWTAHRAHGRIRDLSSLYKEARSRLTPAEQLRWLLWYAGERCLTDELRLVIRTILQDRAIKDRPECR